MPRDQCLKCVYLKDCFPLLRLWQALNPNPCKQGRNKNRQSTLSDVPGAGA